MARHHAYVVLGLLVAVVLGVSGQAVTNTATNTVTGSSTVGELKTSVAHPAQAPATTTVTNDVGAKVDNVATAISGTGKGTGTVQNKVTDDATVTKQKTAISKVQQGTVTNDVAGTATTVDTQVRHAQQGTVTNKLGGTTTNMGTEIESVKTANVKNNIMGTADSVHTAANHVGSGTVSNAVTGAASTVQTAVNEANGKASVNNDIAGSTTLVKTGIVQAKQAAIQNKIPGDGGEVHSTIINSGNSKVTNNAAGTVKNVQTTIDESHPGKIVDQVPNANDPSAGGPPVHSVVNGENVSPKPPPPPQEEHPQGDHPPHDHNAPPPEALVPMALPSNAAAFIDVDQLPVNAIDNSISSATNKVVISNVIKPPETGTPTGSSNRISQSISDSTPVKVSNMVQGSADTSPETPQNENAISNAVLSTDAFPLTNTVLSHHPDSAKNTIANEYSSVKHGAVLLNQINPVQEPDTSFVEEFLLGQIPDELAEEPLAEEEEEEEQPEDAFMTATFQAGFGW